MFEVWKSANDDEHLTIATTIDFNKLSGTSSNLMGKFMQLASVRLKTFVFSCILVAPSFIDTISGSAIGSEHGLGRSRSFDLRRMAATTSSLPTWSAVYTHQDSTKRAAKFLVHGTGGKEAVPTSREDKMNDLFGRFNEKQLTSNEIVIPPDDNSDGATTKTFDYETSSASKRYHTLDEPTKLNSISISANDLLAENSLDEPETMKNNHHQQGEIGQYTTTSSFASSQNSRYYSNNNYKPNYTFNSNHFQPSHYSLGSSGGKYLNYNYQHQNPPNYNLNYIHGFHSKPSQMSSSSNNNNPHHLLNSNHNTLGSLSHLTATYPNHHSNQHQNNQQLLSTYISAASTLSAAVSSLQQSIAANKQLLEPTTPSKLDNLIDIDGHSGRPAEPSVSELPGSEICGRQQVATVVQREPRIVGGNSTHEGEFPWAVSIQRHGNHHCGGVIVAKRWILTAAHCVRSQLVGNLLVRTGGHTLQRSLASQNSLTGHLERDHMVDQIVMHDDFNRFDNLQPPGSSGPQSASGHGNMMKSAANTANNADIALLRLKHDIQLNEFTWPVCFPTREAGNFSGHDAIVIGWGKLSEKSEEFSNELQKVKLTIIDNKVCQNWFRQAGREMPIDDRIICAGFKQGGKDACHGDSGGPLLSRMSNGQYAVVGVVSTGIGCARPLLPGLYSRVSSYISWIERHITARV